MHIYEYCILYVCTLIRKYLEDQHHCTLLYIHKRSKYMYYKGGVSMYMVCVMHNTAMQQTCKAGGKGASVVYTKFVL
jgi:hypothetical protein